MRPLLVCAISCVALVGSSWAASACGQTCDACDANCDSQRNVSDVAPFVSALVDGTAGCSLCAGDVDGNGRVDALDIAPFVNCILHPPPTGACCMTGASCAITTQSACSGLWLGAGTTCTAGACPTGNLTAYRPQHGTGYFPFAKTAVAEVDEEDSVRGPGIRINAPGDADPQGEDDLIEVLVQGGQSALPLALRRTSDALRVWTTRTKMAGTEIPFQNDKTQALSVGPGMSATVWVEWAIAAHGTAELRLEPLAAPLTLDSLRFHTFHSIVFALGGEDQTPSVPVDPNHGTFVLGTALYQRGYDVDMHDEDDVTANGSGPVYDSVVDAIMHRKVDQVSVFGYSHGGGSTHDLADRLDVNRAGIGVFEIVATSYVDGVKNSSDVDVNQETRRPPSTMFHANQYQHGTFADFFLDGGPVPNSDPPPTGLDVETTSWGAGITHFGIDDLVEVRNYVETYLATRLSP